jgi:hypothetical protein
MSDLLAVPQAQVPDEEAQSTSGHVSRLSGSTSADDYGNETRRGTPDPMTDGSQAPSEKKRSFEIGWDGPDDPENPQVRILSTPCLRS